MAAFGRIEFSIGVGVAGLLLLATYLWLDSTSSGAQRVGHEYTTLISELQKQQQHVISEMKKQHDEMMKAMNSQHDDQKRMFIHQQSLLLAANATTLQAGILIEKQAVQEQIQKMAGEQIEWLTKLQQAVTKLKEVNDPLEDEILTKTLLDHFEVLTRMHTLLEPVANQSFIINDKPIPVPQPPAPKKYYISIIMVLRNDDYGGNMVTRLRNWLEIFSYEANQIGLSDDVEVMFIEWNPVEGKPLEELMKQVLPPEKKFPIRIISVPHSIHATIQNPRGIEVYEYMAKNVGMRRANGKFILCTNPDSLFNPNIVGFLGKKKLSEKAFYTMFRTFDDWSLPGGDVQKKIDALVEKTKWGSQGGDALGAEACQTGFVEESRLPQRSWPVDDAPGDFYLIPKEGAFQFRGFSQRPQNFNLDSYILCMSMAHGFAQIVPRGPCLLVHQSHNRPGSYGYVTSGWNFHAYCGNLLSQKNPAYPPEDNGGENWGWANVTLPEVTL